MNSNQKYAEQALRLFSSLRGSESFDLSTEAAELVKTLAGPRVIATSEEL